jgi:hypothetical protein
LWPFIDFVLFLRWNYILLSFFLDWCTNIAILLWRNILLNVWIDRLCIWLFVLMMILFLIILLLINILLWNLIFYFLNWFTLVLMLQFGLVMIIINVFNLLLNSSRNRFCINIVNTITIKIVMVFFIKLRFLCLIDWFFIQSSFRR